MALIVDLYDNRRIPAFVLSGQHVLSLAAVLALRSEKADSLRRHTSVRVAWCTCLVSWQSFVCQAYLLTHFETHTWCKKDTEFCLLFCFRSLYFWVRGHGVCVLSLQRALASAGYLLTACLLDNSMTLSET